MKLILLAALFFSFLHANVYSSELSRESLAKYDHFTCDIEDLGQDRLRILTTSENAVTGAFLDISLRGFTKIEKDGVTVFEKRINEKDGIIGAQLGPDFLFGDSVTRLKLGEEELQVSFDRSTKAIGDKVKFKCNSSSRILIDKSIVCPRCISNDQ